MPEVVCPRRILCIQYPLAFSLHLSGRTLVCMHAWHLELAGQSIGRDTLSLHELHLQRDHLLLIEHHPIAQNVSIFRQFCGICICNVPLQFFHVGAAVRENVLYKRVFVVRL